MVYQHFVSLIMSVSLMCSDFWWLGFVWTLEWIETQDLYYVIIQYLALSDENQEQAEVFSKHFWFMTLYNFIPMIRSNHEIVSHHQFFLQYLSLMVKALTLIENEVGWVSVHLSFLKPISISFHNRNALHHEDTGWTLNF